jgi:hypothetical protein
MGVFYAFPFVGIVCKVHAKDNPDAIYAAKKIRLSGLNEAEKEK